MKNDNSNDNGIFWKSVINMSGFSVGNIMFALIVTFIVTYLLPKIFPDVLFSNSDGLNVIVLVIGLFLLTTLVLSLQFARASWMRFAIKKAYSGCVYFIVFCILQVPIVSIPYMYMMNIFYQQEVTFERYRVDLLIKNYAEREKLIQKFISDNQIYTKQLVNGTKFYCDITYPDENEVQKWIQASILNTFIGQKYNFQVQLVNEKKLVQDAHYTEIYFLDWLLSKILGGKSLIVLMFAFLLGVVSYIFSVMWYLIQNQAEEQFDVFPTYSELSALEKATPKGQLSIIDSIMPKMEAIAISWQSLDFLQKNKRELNEELMSIQRFAKEIVKLKITIFKLKISDEAKKRLLAEIDFLNTIQES